MSISRRSFIKQSAAAIGACTLIGTSASGQVAGANEKVRIALAGCGGRGNEIIGFFKTIPGVEIAYVVDPDSTRMDAAAARIEKEFGNKPKMNKDFRVMLDDKDIDMVAVASANHWHALMGIWACQAGKDVYVEKPCSQRLFEGRKLAEAATKYNRLVQHGTQRRSENTWAKVAAAAQSGKYGKLVAGKVYANRPRGPLSLKPNTKVPDNLDWDLWVGPSAMVPYTSNYVPYNWHWHWNFGSGEIGNNGVHYFDLFRWAAQVDNPDSVISFGTRIVNLPDNDYKDIAETPTIQLAIYDFGGLPLIYESCNIAGPRDKWNPREECELYTEKGIIQGDKFIPNDGSAPQKLDVEFTAPAKGGNFGNLVNCIRDRGSEKLNAPIQMGHFSAGICHWANASYILGEQDSLESIRNKMGDNKILHDSIDKVLANVKDVLDMPEEKMPFMIGPKLVVDKEKDQVVDNPKANEFLTRPARKPFDVPEVV